MIPCLSNLSWRVSRGRAGLIALLLLVTAASQAMALPLDTLTLPPGFTIRLYAADVPDARSMTVSPGGTLFVGTRREGKVYALVDRNHDNVADVVLTIAQGLRMPNGVTFRDGALYVAENHRIVRYDDIEAHLNAPPTPVVLNDTLPHETHHGWRVMRFGPDGQLYVAVGAPCNICQRNDARFASILRLQPDGSRLEVFAHGIRNSVGFDWHPQTHDLWFTDNGRDWLGDEQPADELNYAPQPGLHFGFPYCHAGTVRDPEFGAKRPCSAFVPPVVKLGPHVAALGMRFYTGTMFPPAYQQQIFIAQHGSWNRSTPIGYRLMRVRLDGNQAADYGVFAEGWLQDGKAWGRPVDVQEMPDGALLVSDDRAGVIYRISYTP